MRDHIQNKHVCKILKNAHYYRLKLLYIFVKVLGKVLTKTKMLFFKNIL